MIRLYLSLCLCLPVTLVVTGCAGSAPPQVQHPGAVNTLDSYAFDALTVAQDALENQIRPLVVALSPEKLRTIGPLFNKAIGTLATLQSAHKTYHDAVAAGGSPSVGTLRADVDQLAADVAMLLKQLKG